MENHTPPNIISNSIENNSTKLDRNEKITVSKGSEASSFQLLVREVDNFPDYSDRICQNWLKAHKIESPGDQTIQKYTKIIILLQDIVELIKEIKLKPHSILIAYRALVLGEKNVQVANLYCVKRQIVEQIKKRVIRQQKLNDQIPETWAPISIHLPNELLDAVNWLAEQAKYEQGLIIKRSKKPPELSAETIELIATLLISKNHMSRK